MYYNNVRQVVDVINNTVAFDIKFPSHNKQNKIAEQLRARVELGLITLLVVLIGYATVDGIAFLPSCCEVFGFEAKIFLWKGKINLS